MITPSASNRNASSEFSKNRRNFSSISCWAVMSRASATNFSTAPPASDTGATITSQSTGSPTRPSDHPRKRADSPARARATASTATALDSPSHCAVQSGDAVPTLADENSRPSGESSTISTSLFSRIRRRNSSASRNAPARARSRRCVCQPSSPTAPAAARPSPDTTGLSTPANAVAAGASVSSSAPTSIVRIV